MRIMRGGMLLSITMAASAIAAAVTPIVIAGQWFRTNSLAAMEPFLNLSSPNLRMRYSNAQLGHRDQKSSAVGHSLPSPPIVPDARRPLRPGSDRIAAGQRNDAKDHDMIGQ